jgi:membrane-bound metal-dependent hydrolase YbcI (DUF457 family)
MLSHSLPAISTLATIAAIFYVVWLRDPAGMLVVFLVVLSHAAGDYLTGIKPTWTGGPMIGLMLYRKPVIDFVIEAAVIVVGWNLYRRSLPVDRRSAEPAFTMLGALLVIQAGADVFLTFAKGLRKC